MYGTIYRPYLLDMDRINNCDGYQSQTKLSKNVFNTVILDLIKKFYPSVVNDCPFQGYVGEVDMDLNATLAQVMPPILPRGNINHLTILGSNVFFNDRSIQILWSILHGRECDNPSI